MTFLRSTLFYIVLGVGVLFIVPTLLLLLVCPLRVRGRAGGLWSSSLLYSLRVICGLKYEVEDHRESTDDAVIILSKHQSAWETFALQVLFPPLSFVLKRELLWIPLFGWGLMAVGAIAIDRKGGKAALMQVIDKGTQRLKEGVCVVIFPEGTRIPPGEQGRYNFGGAMLASRSGYPVVPVAHNAGEFWPGRGYRIRPGTIKVVIGAPLESQERSAGEINKTVEGWIENQMERITGPEYRDGENSPLKAQTGKP